MQTKKSAVVKRVQNGIITEYMAINSKLPKGKQIKRFPVKTSDIVKKAKRRGDPLSGFTVLKARAEKSRKRAVRFSRRKR